MTEVQCGPGLYREGSTNTCKPCMNCSSKAYDAGNRFHEACLSTERCPRWCGVYDQPSNGEQPPDCIPKTTAQPTTPSLTTTPGYTTGFPEGSTKDFTTTSTKDVTLPSPSPGDQSNNNIGGILSGIFVPAIVCILLAFVVYKYRKRLCIKYAQLKMRSGSNLKLKTFMVDPSNWHLDIVNDNAVGACPNQRLWLTVTNTNTQEKIVEEKEQFDEKLKILLPLLPPGGGSFCAKLGTRKRINKKTTWIHRLDITVPKEKEQFDEKLKILLPLLPPGGGSFCAKLGTRKRINKKTTWIHRLDITVPSQPCTCSLDSLMTENSTLNGVYHLLCIDMNSSVDSVKKIAKVMQRNISEINSLSANAERKPFDALILLVTSESDVNVSHIIMGLTCNDMTETEERVVKYLLKWHSNCRMCHHIWAHNTGAQLQTVTVDEINRVV